LRPELPRRSIEQADFAEIGKKQSADAIRARANRLYMVGEMARAAQLLMKLKGQSSQA
jgi:hypothetical protein